MYDNRTAQKYAVHITGQYENCENDGPAYKT